MSLEFYGIIPQTPWRTRELLVSPSKQGWSGGLGFQRLLHKLKGEQPRDLPSLRQRHQCHWCIPPWSPCPVVPKIWLLPDSPCYFLWDSWLPPAQALISFHQPCATFCSASRGSTHAKFSRLASDYGKTGTREEVSPKTKMLWVLGHRAAGPWSSDPNQCFRNRSGASAT